MVVLSELQEGSSSSSTHGHLYDVFLSFRGLDTRHGFTNHLHKALMDANITTFLDNEEIETGEDLKPELEGAIKASRASIIVLSKNYATSTWCLDELVFILEHRMASNHIVLPIFYHVEPTHVRKQQGSFGYSMAKHRQMMEAETDANKRIEWAQKMNRWNQALKGVADLKGMVANGRPEVEFIDDIVNHIWRTLRISSRFLMPHIIGMNNSIIFMTSWLKDVSSHKTDILTISGMGGIGKTSLAKYAYALHYDEFDRSSFIEDINTKCEKSNGMLDVQKQLYDDISKRRSLQVHDVSTYTSMIEKTVAHRKAFLVLDDIGSLDQLDALLGSKGFHPGTKIIITTKDTSLTQRCSLFKTNIKPKHAEHKLEGLSKIDSRKNLCFHAFIRDDPKEGYEEVTETLVQYCDGHPMALKLLGRSLHGREVDYWEGYIDKLMKENGSPIHNVLKMSFDSLPSENDKDLFKHIACLFVGTDRDDTITILEACRTETKSGITNLIEKFLLSISWDNKLVMHQLVQEMGRFVVREESLYKPWKRSRLWGHESFRVLKQKKGTENIVGLTLDMRMLDKEKFCRSFELKTDALTKMDSLMLLQLNYVKINGSYEDFPEELRWLCMHGFPSKSMPLDLPMENLVALDMSYSNIESFGIPCSNPQQKHLTGSCLEDVRLPGSLKILNLSFCEQLHSLSGFHQLPVLERLIVRNCINLLQICESLEQCFELVLVDLGYCNKLEKLPRIIDMLKSVKILSVEGCNLRKSRFEIRDMDPPEKIEANNTDMSTTTTSTAVLKAMPSDSKFFVIKLPRSLVRLSLANNSLSTESFPIDFRCLSVLKELYLDNNPVTFMPHCVRSLPKLQILSMKDCEMLTSVEHPPPTLTYLDLYSKHNSLLRKVVFDTKMSPLDVYVEGNKLLPSLIEFEGLVKIQPMADVEEMVSCSLGWKSNKLGVHNERGVLTFSCDRTYVESEIQMYYEFGIFSTIYGGEEMPNWISARSTGASISFSIPSSPDNLTRLNFCYVHKSLDFDFQYLPMIMISNITRNLAWVYDHYIDEVLDDDGQCFTFLSHWMFGMNEMECGDEVHITVIEKPYDKQVTKECGVGFVYDDGEEHALDYYKSWNHIIGGDLIGFQLTTGEYFLSKLRILVHDVDIVLQPYRHVCGEGVSFKDKQVHFRAFSQMESGVLDDDLEDDTQG